MLNEQLSREELISHLDNNDVLFDRWVQEGKISANEQGLFDTHIFLRLRAEVYGYLGSYPARGVNFHKNAVR